VGRPGAAGAPGKAGARGRGGRRGHKRGRRGKNGKRGKRHGKRGRRGKNGKRGKRHGKHGRHGKNGKRGKRHGKGKKQKGDKKTKKISKANAKWLPHFGWYKPEISFSTRQTSFSSSKQTTHNEMLAAYYAGGRPTGYCSKSVPALDNLQNQKVCPGGSNSNLGYHFVTTFHTLYDGFWRFRVGSDFGRGGEMSIDNRILARRVGENLWWAQNWGSNAVMTSGWILLTAGRHELSVLGFEDCCDGQNSVQYERKGEGGWKTISQDELAKDSKKTFNKDQNQIEMPDPADAKLFFGTRHTSAGTTKDTTDTDIYRMYYAGTRVNGYCKKPVDTLIGRTNGNTCSGVNSNIAYRAGARFTLLEGGRWKFRVGPDFGRGGVMFLDSRMVVRRTGENLWWAGNWNSPAVMTTEWIRLGQGRHLLEVIGFEDCCDGAMSIQYMKKGGQWSDLTKDKLTQSTESGGHCGKSCEWIKKHPEALDKLKIDEKWRKRLLYSRSLRHQFGLTPQKMREMEQHPNTAVKQAVKHVAPPPPPPPSAPRPHPPPPPPPPPAPCFPASATVELASGRSVRMDELQHGDRVLTVTSSGALEHREVFFFGHRDPHALSSFQCVTIANHPRPVCLTRDHFMLAAEAGVNAEWADARYTRGGMMKSGMAVWHVEQANNGKMVKSIVTSVAAEYMYGLYNPYTEENAMIVVNGVVASTHSTWFLDNVMPQRYDHLLPSIYEAALFPARAAYRLMGAEWAKSVQARLPLDSLAHEQAGFVSLVAPYAELLWSETPLFASKIVSKLA